VKMIFVAKIGSAYDDLIEERDHFPKRYLRRVEQAVGDFIIYYQSRRGGGQLSYFAYGRVTEIYPDCKKDDHYYARIEDYLNFDRPVGFRQDGGYESALISPDGILNPGTAQNAIRGIPETEFNAIVSAGFVGEAKWPNRDAPTFGFEEEQAEFERPIVESIVNRKFRDIKFRQQVQSAYDRRCALTGLRLINGGGRPEVEAAHIKPVAVNGPDSVRNGIALSGTVHWMFDRGLISLRDDYSILLSRQLNSDVSHLLTKDMYAIVPMEQIYRPSPIYLEYHRDQVFKH
jgi:putative restriction endonuclease